MNFEVSNLCDTVCKEFFVVNLLCATDYSTFLCVKLIKAGYTLHNNAEASSKKAMIVII